MSDTVFLRMNIPKFHWESERVPTREQLIEQQALVRNSLLGANYQNRWMKVGIAQVLNRLLILWQKPTAIALFRISGRHRIQLLFHTLLDPLWRTKFEEYLGDEIGYVRGDFIYIPHGSYDGYAIELFKDYYIMVFAIATNLEQSPFTPVPINDETCYRLSDTIGEFGKSSGGRNLFSEYLKPEMDSFLNCWEGGHIQFDAVDSTHSEVATDPHYHWDNITDIFSKEYLRVFSSPLISDGHKNPPNIFFFIRDYMQKDSRFHGESCTSNGCYRHGVRAVIPDPQKSHLKRAFELLSTCERDGDYFYFPIESVSLSKDGTFKYFPTKKSPERNRKFSGNDKFFWDSIATDEGRERVLSEMVLPFGSKARSISDSVLFSGFVHIKEDPFCDGGSNRIEEELRGMGPDSLDYRRLVYYHYALSMMAPKSGELSAVLIPGYIGGSSVICSGFISKRNALHPHEQWLDIYHFYHSVSHYVIRGIRRSYQSLYLKALVDVYISQLSAICEDISYGKRFDPMRVSLAVNKKLKELCRIFPFPQVEMYPAPRNNPDLYNSEYNYLHKFLDSYFYAVKLKDNPYFKQVVKGVFLRHSGIKSALKDADRVLVDRTQLAIYLRKKSTPRLR